MTTLHLVTGKTPERHSESFIPAASLSWLFPDPEAADTEASLLSPQDWQTEMFLRRMAGMAMAEYGLESVALRSRLVILEASS